MLSLIRQLFVHNWQRKLVALALATIIWALINHSITVTRTFSGVPIRVVNLPPNKTIEGMTPDGLLDRRTTLILSGRKTTLDELSPSDLEVVIDARGKGDQWIVKITKQMLVCTNPEIDINRSITEVSHTEFVLKLSPLITDKIPIYIMHPRGEPPAGYQYLDVWPQVLYQSVSGPEDQVRHLKNTGLELTFDLSAISEKDLEALTKNVSSTLHDEISFLVPAAWKRAYIPFMGEQLQEINDPDADQLRIDFLRKELLSLDTLVPLSFFYPLQFGTAINPSNTTLAPSDLVSVKNGLTILNLPLYARNVSRLFLDIVRDHLQIIVVVSPPKDQQLLEWSLQFIDPAALEQEYVATNQRDFGDAKLRQLNPSLREEYLRTRFQSYMRKLELYTADDKKLKLDIRLQGASVTITNASQ